MMQYRIEQADGIDFVNSIPDNSINLIVTSPPYNMDREYESRRSVDRYLLEQEQMISVCVKKLAIGGSICWQVGHYVSHGEVYPLDILLYDIFKKQGLQLRNRIVWTFGHGLHCKKRLSGRHETILLFTKGENYKFNVDPIRIPSLYPNKKHYKGPKKGQLSGNPLGKNPGDVWNIPNVKSNHVEKTDHPCQFPVNLIERLVLSTTNEGDSVLDPYIGSGTSAIAALKHNRVAYGCDLFPEYIAITMDRIHKLELGILKIRPMNKAVHQPK